MNCTHCGNSMEPGSAFCSSCGNAISQEPAAQTASVSSSGYQKGGFGRRLTAQLIDYFLLSSLTLALFSLLGIAGDYQRGYHGLDAYQEMAGSGGFVMASIAVAWLYFSLMETFRSASIGKLILGLRVVDDEGCMISFGKATGRFFSKMLSGLILGIGFLIMLTDENRETLHDGITKTQVIEVEH